LPFRSILYDGLTPTRRQRRARYPSSSADLRLDQVVASIIAGRQAYDLAPFYQAR